MRTRNKVIIGVGALLVLGYAARRSLASGRDPVPIGSRLAVALWGIPDAIGAGIGLGASVDAAEGDITISPFFVQNGTCRRRFKDTDGKWYSEAVSMALCETDVED